MMWLLIKLLGVMDLFAAAVIFFGLYDLPFIAKAILLPTLFITGVMNFFYRDALSIIDGATDLAAVFLIATAIAVPNALKLVVILIMVEKGIVSIL